MSVFTDNSERFATRDRAQVADQVLENACREVVAAHRAARRLEERYPDSSPADGLVAGTVATLDRAVASADRILGPTPEAVSA